MSFLRPLFLKPWQWAAGAPTVITSYVCSEKHRSVYINIEITIVLIQKVGILYVFWAKPYQSPAHPAPSSSVCVGWLAWTPVSSLPSGYLLWMMDLMWSGQTWRKLNCIWGTSCGLWQSNFVKCHLPLASLWQWTRTWKKKKTLTSVVMEIGKCLLVSGYYVLILRDNLSPQILPAGG